MMESPVKEYNHGAVAHFDIAGTDAVSLGHFYSRVFGWTVVPKGPGYALIETPDGAPNGAVIEAETSSITMGVTVQSLTEALVAAEASGGRIIMPETDNGWVKKAQIEDPFGNIVTLIEL